MAKETVPNRRCTHEFKLEAWRVALSPDLQRRSGVKVRIETTLHAAPSSPQFELRVHDTTCDGTNRIVNVTLWRFTTKPSVPYRVYGYAAKDPLRTRPPACWRRSGALSSL
jgi:hypothetical protein